jgi:hypothetical protein
MRTPWLFALLMLLGSCGVESARPLTPASTAKLDPALLGHWEGVDGEAKGMAFDITVARGAVVLVAMAPKEGREPMAFEGHVSVLGKLKVLNLQLIEDGKIKGGYVFVRYEVQADGTLETWLLDDAPVQAAIKKGTLTGGRTQYGGTTIDDLPAKLVRFLTEAKPEERFEKFATLKKKL